MADGLGHFPRYIIISSNDQLETCLIFDQTESQFQTDETGETGETAQHK